MSYVYVCITCLSFIFNKEIAVSYICIYIDTMKALILCRIHSANV